MSVARLDVGQRVFVLGDESGAPVGAWGTVARKCYGNALAWVRLDERHARCPFPPDTEGRATWILTVPEQCSSVAPAPDPGALEWTSVPDLMNPGTPPAARCRRCVECIGEEHHWLTSVPDFSLMAAGGDPFIPCKHCDARAGVCSECFEGAVWPLPPATAEAAFQRCELCRAVGGV